MIDWLMRLRKGQEIILNKLLMISLLALCFVLAAGMGVNLSIGRLASSNTAQELLFSSETSMEEASTSASQQLLKSPPRRAKKISESPTREASAFSINAFGMMLAAFMESFGIVYVLNATQVKGIRDSLQAAWLIWLFLIFPATVLHFIYHRPSPAIIQERQVLVVAAFQLLRVILEALIMSQLIFTLRK